MYQLTDSGLGGDYVFTLDTIARDLASAQRLATARVTSWTPEPITDDDGSQSPLTSRTGVWGLSDLTHDDQRVARAEDAAARTDAFGWPVL